MNQKDELGKSGEDYACAYLKRNKYTILERNFRCKVGEIDIIAERDNILCFIEVKTRHSKKFGSPAEAVTISKQKRIYRCAEYYMQVKGIIHSMPILSFDVIEILYASNGVKEFNHYRHCF